MTYSHSDLVIVNGRKAYIGTVTGYAARYREDVQIAFARAIANRHETHWIGLEPTVLCGDKGYYERETAKWANVPRVQVGDSIRIADAFGVRTFTLHYAPNHNFRLVEVK